MTAPIEIDPPSVRRLDVQVAYDAKVLGPRVIYCAVPVSADTTAREVLADRLPLDTEIGRGKLPADLTSFVNLDELIIAGDIEGTLPDDIAALSLKVLVAEDWEGLEALPALPRSLVILRLPASLRSLAGGLDFPDLQQLYIPIDLLREHRADIPKLVNLVELVVFGPEPTDDPWGRESGFTIATHELPGEVTRLGKLRRLETKRVGLESLPAGITSMTSLGILELWCARLTSVVDVVRALPNLARLDTTGNRLSAYEERWLAKLMDLEPEQRASMKPPPPPKPKKATHRRLEIKAWDAVCSLAVSADGTQVIAGERGGFRVCAWELLTGALQWDRTLVEGRDVDAYTHVSYTADGLIVAVPSTFAGHVFWLDATDGAPSRQKTLGFGLVPVLAERAGVLFANRLVNDTWGGPAATYTYPALEARGELPDAVAEIRPDGRMATLQQDGELQLVELPSSKLGHTIDEGGPHCFTPDGTQLVVLARDRLQATIYDIATGKRRERFSWAPDCSELAEKKQPEPGWPVFDPSGRYLAIARSRHGSKVDGTVGVIEWSSKKLVAATPAHERPLARLDPHFGSTSLSSRRDGDFPRVAWRGGELLVAGLIRADDEPRAGTGVTIHSPIPSARK